MMRAVVADSAVTERDGVRVGAVAENCSPGSGSIADVSLAMINPLIDQGECIYHNQSIDDHE